MNKAIMIIIMMCLVCCKNSTNNGEKMNSEGKNNHIEKLTSQDISKIINPEDIDLAKIDMDSMDFMKKNYSVKRKFAKIEKYGTDKQLQSLLLECASIYDGALDNILNKMRGVAIKNNNWEEINKFTDSFLPAYRILNGGEAIYNAPNIEYFLEKSERGSMSYKFFSLAMYGWWTPDQHFQFGKEVWPPWFEPETGITGEFIEDVAEDYIKKWENLKPELKGTYLDIANATIELLNKKIDRYRNNKE